MTALTAAGDGAQDKQGVPKPANMTVVHPVLIICGVHKGGDDAPKVLHGRLLM